MAGVVYSDSLGLLSRFGQPVAVTSGGIIPAGMWICSANWTVTYPPVAPSTTATTVTGNPGICVSDGKNVTAGAAGTLVPLGA
jgi:hypothetical protein